MNKILVIDDDKYIRELICTLLKNEGFDVIPATDGLDALDKMEDDKVDLCVLDLMMPNMDGIEFCKEIRQYYDEIPVLMLTAKAQTNEKVRGFEVGADDYLTKPFEPAELIVRVKALLRRYKISYSRVIEIGNTVINKNEYSVNIGNSTFEIPLMEFNLLLELSINAGKIQSRDKLIENVWGYDFVGNERTLDVHINRLRDRFPVSETGFEIKTIRGLGYKLEAIK